MCTQGTIGGESKIPNMVEFTAQELVREKGAIGEIIRVSIIGSADVCLT